MCPGDAPERAFAEEAMSIRLIPLSKTLVGRLVLILAAMVAIQAIVLASPALAITERPGNTDMTNGEVYATALSENGDTLFIAGKFTRVKDRRSDGVIVGRAATNLAALDAETGDMIQTWRPQVTGDVGAPAVVRSLAVKDGRVYFGGNFTAVEGQPRKNLAAVSTRTASVNLSSFAPQVGKADSFVYALEASDSKLYAGGGFSQVNGEPHKNLAAFNLATSTQDPRALNHDWEPATSAKVRALKLGPLQATLFVGGSFSHITGSEGGTGEDRQSVARLYADTGDLHPWKIPAGTIAAPQTAWDLTWSDGRLYAGFGATANYLAAFSIKPDSPGRQIWRFNTRGNVQSVALTTNDSRLFFGGHFGLNNLDKKVCHRSKYLRGLASVDPDTGKIYCDFVPSLDQAKRPSYQGAWTLTTTRSHLWVGGGFKGISASEDPKPVPNPRVSDWPQTNLARFGL